MSEIRAASVTSAALAALARATLGDLQPAELLVGQWEHEAAAVIRAWRLALCVVLWQAGARCSVTSSSNELGSLARGDAATRHGAVCALTALLRGRVLALDTGSVSELFGLLRRAGSDAQSPSAEIALELGATWHALADGDPEQVTRHGKRSQALAQSQGVADALVESTALLALAALSEGQLADGVATARRAMRMARTEELPQQEYLAALVLARARRLQGQGHLAGRILSSLRRYAPTPWHPILDWEAIMATGHDSFPSTTETPACALTGPALALAAWLRAAEDGRAADFRRLGQSLSDQIASFAPAQADFRIAGQLIDPDAGPSDDREIEAWRTGVVHPVPYGCSGLASPGSDGRTVACVIAGGGSAPVRVLTVGAGLAEDSWRVSAAATAKHARTQILLAVLALAGPEGLSDERAFALAYEFQFNPELHRDTFNVTVHRARAQLGPEASILRDEGHLTLELPRRSAIPDPRCALPLGQQVLRHIALAGGVTARDIAGSLGVSVRSAQAALETLLEDGACERKKVGRSVQYVVEDTTFQEPTRHR